MVISEAGPGERYDAQGHGEEPQKEQEAARGGARRGTGGAGGYGYYAGGGGGYYGDGSSAGGNGGSSFINGGSGGTGGQADPFVETKDQPMLAQDGLARVVYVGAEFCPYCAIMRWSLVAALSRFGTFKGLKETSSSADVAPIPTFSFLGATYTSKYLRFTPYETNDRNGAALQTPPASVEKLYTTYDGTATTTTKFTGGSESGTPFLDIANEHVSSGDAAFLDPTVDPLAGGGPGMLRIAQAIAHPSSTVAKAIDSQVSDTK